MSSSKPKKSPTIYSNLVSTVSPDSRELESNIESIKTIIAEAEVTSQGIKKMEIVCFDESKLDEKLKPIYDRHLQSIDSTYKLLIDLLGNEFKNYIDREVSSKKDTLKARIFMTIQTEEMKAQMKDQITSIETIIQKIDNLPKPKDYNFNPLFRLTGARRDTYEKLYNVTIPSSKHLLSMAESKFKVLLLDDKRQYSRNKDDYKTFYESEQVYTYNYEILKEFEEILKEFEPELGKKSIKLDDYKEGSDKNPLITSSGGKRRKSKSRKSRKGRKKSRKSRRR
jgi:hypothetical protein